jgi:hypothetical protein
MLVGSAAALILLGGLLTGSVAMQRAFAASDRLARAESDMLRVADYMSRDVRNATNINSTATGTVLLTVTTSDYYDRRGTLSDPTDDVANTPVLGRNGATYGASPITIRYLRSGTNILREVRRVDAGVASVATTRIADNVEALAVSVGPQGEITFASSTAMNYRVPKTGGQSPALSFTMTSQPRNSAL